MGYYIFEPTGYKSVTKLLIIRADTFPAMPNLITMLNTWISSPETLNRRSDCDLITYKFLGQFMAED